MAAKLKRYKSLHTTLVSIRNQDVMAIRVTDKNVGDIAEEVAKLNYDAITLVDKSGANRRVKIKTPKGLRVAKVGDFVVKVRRGPDNKGNAQKPVFHVVKDDVFEVGFKLATSADKQRFYPNSPEA